MSSAATEREASPRRNLLTVGRVAELLSLSKSTVYDLVARGELEAFKVGGSVRIPREAVRSLLEKSRI